jgi:hypothetical protein
MPGSTVLNTAVCLGLRSVDCPTLTFILKAPKLGGPYSARHLRRRRLQSRSPITSMRAVGCLSSATSRASSTSPSGSIKSICPMSIRKWEEKLFAYGGDVDYLCAKLQAGRAYEFKVESEIDDSADVQLRNSLKKILKTGTAYNSPSNNSRRMITHKPKKTGYYWISFANTKPEHRTLLHHAFVPMVRP